MPAWDKDPASKERRSCNIDLSKGLNKEVFRERAVYTLNVDVDFSHMTVMCLFNNIYKYFFHIHIYNFVASEAKFQMVVNFLFSK